MSRLPSMRDFLEMTELQRAFTIERHLTDLVRELRGIELGCIVPWNGRTKSHLLRSCRRRIKHLEAVAAELSAELPEAA